MLSYQIIEFDLNDWQNYKHSTKLLKIVPDHQNINHIFEIILMNTNACLIWRHHLRWLHNMVYFELSVELIGSNRLLLIDVPRAMSLNLFWNSFVYHSPRFYIFTGSKTMCNSTFYIPKCMITYKLLFECRRRWIYLDLVAIQQLFSVIMLSSRRNYWQLSNRSRMTILTISPRPRWHWRHLNWAASRNRQRCKQFV